MVVFLPVSFQYSRAGLDSVHQIPSSGLPFHFPASPHRSVSTGILSHSRWHTISTSILTGKLSKLIGGSQKNSECGCKFGLYGKLSGLQPQCMSGSSGLFNSKGSTVCPAGNVLGSPHLPSSWHWDLTVMLRLSEVNQVGHLQYVEKSYYQWQFCMTHDVKQMVPGFTSDL